jgi:hypothetical protein
MSGRRNPYSLLVGMKSRVATMEINMVVLKKLKIEQLYDPAIYTTPEYRSEGM